MKEETINITIERSLWNGLSTLAYRQSILRGKRFCTIDALRLAIKVFLKMAPQEINEVLDRKPEDMGSTGNKY
jgi:hypothetical protein